jgi:precorrin-6x reductase
MLYLSKVSCLETAPHPFAARIRHEVLRTCRKPSRAEAWKTDSTTYISTFVDASTINDADVKYQPSMIGISTISNHQ